MGTLMRVFTGYQSAPEPSQTVTSSLLYHEFAVPQHPGNAAAPPAAGREAVQAGLSHLPPLLLTLRTPAHPGNHGKEGARIGTGRRRRRRRGEGRRGVFPQQAAEAQHGGQGSVWGRAWGAGALANTLTPSPFLPRHPKVGGAHRST